MLKNALKYTHYLLSQTIEKGEFVIDATAGNGHDTIMLANLVGETGQVLAFDIQVQAIQKTKELLENENISNVTIIHDSHSNVESYLTEEMKNNIGAAVFNLGYLPGGNHQITTKPNTTLKALEVILQHLKKSKLVVLVVYYGHEGGKEEKDQLMAFLQSLDQKQYQVLQYQFINQKSDPPFLLAIEKKA